ncbi:MAG: NERD domain-containing protein [Snowella sp.]|nr:NERD domain-containing protein [Snowella sp.]
MPATADDVWQLLAELTTKQAQLTLAQQETDRQIKETNQQLKETDRQLKETDRYLKEQFKETDRRIREVDRQIGNLGGKWGRFVENMVAPACETLFINRGIPVHQVSQRVKKRLNGQTLEIDILVTNANHVLVVEVKSTLGVNDVRQLMEDLNQFRQFFPEYHQKQLYGAVAGIEIEEGADRYAYRQGLFVLAQTGENVSILNPADFQPRNWQAV